MSAATRSLLSRSWWLPALLSAVAAFLFFKDFGVAWDDPLQRQYGDRLVSFYATGGADRSYEDLADLRYYGGAFELPAQIVAGVSPFTVIETRRLLGALVGAFGVLGCGALGLRLGGPIVGWLSGALLASWPAWVGHSFINSKDVPFAAFFVWATYFLVRVALQREGVRLADHLGFAVFSGLAIGTRAGGLILLGAYAALLVREIVLVMTHSVAHRVRRVAAVVVTFAAAAASAWIVMMLMWPWTQDAPLSRPFEAAHLMTRFPRPMEVLFKGELITTRRLPWDYVPTWLGATLPPLVVILLVASVVLAVLRLRDRTPWPGAAELIVLVLATGPLFAAITGRVVLYDGIRQLLFVVPLLMVVAAWAAVDLFTRLRVPSARWAACAVAVVACLDPLSALTRLHPYQYIYFNSLVGGLRSAAGRFETDYWGLAMRETAEWVNANQRALKSRGNLKVFVPHNCAEPTSAGAYLDPSVRLTDNNLAGDYVLAPTRFGCDKDFKGTTVFKAERDGAVLAVVRVME